MRKHTKFLHIILLVSLFLPASTIMFGATKLPLKKAKEDGIVNEAIIDVPELKLHGRAYSRISRKGFLAEAGFDEWVFGPLRVSGLGSDKIRGTADDGPFARIRIDKDWEFYLSGLIDMFGNTGTKIQVEIARKHFIFKTSLYLLGVFKSEFMAKSDEGYKSFAIDGKIKFGRAYSRLRGYIGGDSLSNSALTFHMKSLTFEALLKTANDIIEKQIHNRPIPAKILGSFPLKLELEDLSIGIAFSDTMFEGHMYKQGFSFEANMNLPIIKIPTRIRASTDQTGVKMSGEILPFNIGILKVGGAGVDKKRGTADDSAIVYIELSKTPHFYVDGMVELFGINTEAKINISKEGFSFRIITKIADMFTSSLYAESQGRTKEDIDFIIVAKMRGDFFAALEKAIKSSLDEFKKISNREITKAQKEVRKLNGEMTKLQGEIDRRNRKIAKLRKIMKKRVAHNTAKVQKAQNKVNTERANVRKVQQKIAADRAKIKRWNCNAFRKFPFIRYAGCVSVRGIAATTLRAVEGGVGVSSKAALDIAIAALEVAKETLLLNPANFKEHGETIKLGLELSGLETAKGGTIAAREIAVGTLEAAKHMAAGFSNLGKQMVTGMANLSKIVHIKQASIHFSLRELVVEKKLPRIKSTVSLMSGPYKKFDFQFDLDHPEKALQELGFMLVGEAMQKV